MKISEPLELKNVKKTIENLSKLDFVIIEKRGEEFIIKQKLTGKFIRLRKLLNCDWIGQILKDVHDEKYYLYSARAIMVNVDDWDKIKLFMECLE